LARSFLRSAADASSTFTGSASIWWSSSSRLDDFDFHFVEQPKTPVCATFTGWPASSASIALRVSCVFTSDSRWLLSMRPSKRSLRWASKMNTCGVAFGP